MFSQLYQKSLKLASHKSSKFFLAIVSFAESSFFPIPPDIMMIPMIIAKKNDYFKIFIIATIGSALGGVLGYFIGSTFMDLAMNVIQIYGYEEKVIALKNDLSEGSEFYVFLGALFLAGFTPLPFKVFTITSGIIGFNVVLFFFICLLSRGLRFFVVSYLTYKFGDTFDNFIKKKNNKYFIILGLIIIVISVILYFVIK
ncbi:DedA family protein [Candidatus Pelagibacter sp.]|nr:DedA family protein [Candidatus Pelagibacter sp.]